MKGKLQPSSCSFKAHQSWDIWYSHICAAVCKKRLCQNSGEEMWVNWLCDLEQATCPQCEMKMSQTHSHLRKTPWLSRSWGNWIISSLRYRWFILALGCRERTWVLSTCLCFMCWATCWIKQRKPYLPTPCWLPAIARQAASIYSGFICPAIWEHVVICLMNQICPAVVSRSPVPAWPGPHLAFHLLSWAHLQQQQSWAAFD